MTHILFKVQGNIPGYIQIIGMYLNYNYARIADEYNDMRVELNKLGATVIPEEVAKGFVFSDIYKDYISVRTNSHIMDEMPQLAESSEQETEKIKYFLSEDDKLSADYEAPRRPHRQFPQTQARAGACGALNPCASVSIRG